MSRISLPVRNLAGKPVRTALLMLLTALLAAAVLAGTLLVGSLRTGLNALEARLGADVMVVPYEATSKSSVESIILQGNIGYFYMDSSVCTKLASREGVAQMSEQFFLASTSAGCCSVPVQIIGFDPETDFTVTPWIRRNGAGVPGDLDLIVGSDLNAFVGDTLTFYGVDCHVAAKLDRTGTYFDTAVFANAGTVKTLIRSSIDRHMNDFSNADPDKVVSCVLLNAADGYSAQELADDINIHVRKVKAICTKDLIAGVSESLKGVSGITGVLIAAVWLLGVIVLVLAFAVSIHARMREFAVLRVIGMPRVSLGMTVLKEALLTGCIGAAAGVLLALLVMLPFRTLIEESLGLPYLLPGAGKIALLAVLAWAITAAVSAAAAGFSAYRISRVDPAQILRGDA